MEPEQSSAEMRTTSAPPRRWPITLVVLLLGATAFSLVYAARERRREAHLAAANEQITATLSQTQSEVDALKAKLAAMAEQPSASPSPPPQPMPAETHRAVHKNRGSQMVQANRWKKIDDRLAAQQKEIATTQQDLASTRTDLEGKLSSAHDELNGSIARTHDELVALEKKGERNYYEFDLAKSKQFRHVGPLSLSLRKISTKHEYYDMAMVVDDRQLSKKHVNLYEPVWIYPADSHQPLEVVVNQITKDGVHGYLSTPKYTESESAPGTAAGTATAPTSSNSANGSVPGGGSSPTQDSLSQRP